MIKNNSVAYDLEFCENKLIPVIQAVTSKYISIPIQIEQKSHGNFVTSVDKAIEMELKRQLSSLISEAGFIAEESGDDSKNGLNWVIDPIDGTTNFIYGFQYAISVALTSQESGCGIIGVVYCPTSETLYYACHEQGAYVVRNGTKNRLKVGEFSDSEGIAIFGMPYDRAKTGKIFTVAEKIYGISSDLKRIGPSSLDICTVAEGKAKLYFELDLNIWDICAGLLILKEAGGNYIQDDDLSLFATNEVFELYRKIAER